jgi:acetoacetyl-CoA synthetase
VPHPLYTPTPERIASANVTRFTAFCAERLGRTFAGYADLYQWSVDDIPAFWAAVWDFLEIIHSAPYDTVVDDLARFPGASWFPGARLNFAQNLLRYDDDRVAILFKGETRPATRTTYRELNQTVARLARALRAAGVQSGDVVAGYLPNLPETAMGMLATVAIGAVWTSCATDIGPQAAVDRLGQVEPKVLLCADGYLYKDKTFDSFVNATQVVAAIPSIAHVVVATYAGNDVDLTAPGAARAAVGLGAPTTVRWDDFLAGHADAPLDYAQVPFDHPAVVMFSSGTTGKPKCLVQSGGGLLLNQLKELTLHADVQRDDILFYITTASWMMWNWLISGLGTGATIVLFDGNPAYPDLGALWRFIEAEGVTMFGTSASYINLIKAQGLEPARDYDLSKLREILQTGSALSPEGFAYVYDSIKLGVHFNSIAGGTDINGCFCIGTPTLPVYPGELQARGLGMKVECFDETGKPVRDQVGELVCLAPAPPMPLYFWHDPDGRRYHDAYFDVFPGVWRHGDYVLIHGDTGGVTFYGRSDAVLKPSGVRIGTAEIYNQVEQLPEIQDSLAIGQDWQGDQRVLLFVKLAPGYELTEELQKKIAKTLRENASPRHVPAKAIAVADIPYTLNGKKVETAVTNILHGRPVTNRDSLANPESLDIYAGLVGELTVNANGRGDIE